MKKWYQILWGSREERELEQKVRNSDSPDPDELNIENAYKTRWIWYHTILKIIDVDGKHDYVGDFLTTRN